MDRDPPDAGSTHERSDSGDPSSGESAASLNAETGAEDEAGAEAHTTGRRTLSPRVRLQWLLRMLVATAVIAAVAAAIAPRVGLDPRVGPGLGAALTVLGTGHTLLRYRVWAYEVRADTLYLQRGVLTRTRTLVPYVRIQHVDTQRSPAERALGLSTLVVYTAGSRGADVSIPGLTPSEAEDLQGRVKELAIKAEGGDAV